MKDGGPAFPTRFYEDGEPQIGMSLQDKFADSAMRALIPFAVSGEVDDYTPQAVAHDAYNYADAMIAEREKRA
jgi:hypothetical protein